jgi:phosphate transport system permease protein
MSDQTQSTRTIDLVRKTLDRRYRAERRFKLFGLAAIICGLLFLVIMFTSIIGNGYTAFYQSYVKLDIIYDAEKVDPRGDGSEDSFFAGDYGGVVKQSLRDMYPMIEGRGDKKKLYEVISGGAGYEIRDRLIADNRLLNKSESLWLLMDDDADMFFKGHVTDIVRQRQDQQMQYETRDGTINLVTEAPVLRAIVQDVRDNLEKLLRERTRELKRFEQQIQQEGGDEAEQLSTTMETLRNEIARLEQELSTGESSLLAIPRDMPSYLIRTQQGYLKLTSVAAGKAGGEWLLRLDDSAPSLEKDWQVTVLTTAEPDRRTNDKQAAILLSLQDQGRVELRFNTTFFTAGDSREPEQSGILSAAKGSFYMLIVTLLLSFPIGVASAVYLEEFAPQNRWTDFIEVNINNLAAVPSIVFGLLGLAVFLNFFTLPRSAPLVGGLVLTLMTLPTIIISGRAALKSVPPSIREAALGIGASKVQTVFYHVLPLALPGMLTGTIIGMAQALGESAPLLMIGMVAFIVDVPQGFTDPSTVLPVQIYLWADSPERAFVERTSAAIMVLLAFLISMNALAVILRKRFERRW